MSRIILSFAMVGALCTGVLAQTTGFTYQGSLISGGTPATGNFDFEFKLFDAVSAGTQQGSTQQRLNVAVANGVFAVSLDFGAGTLPGADRFLDIAVRTAGGGAFTALSPRQKVNSAPYSIKSLNSTTADLATNATQLGGVAANQYVLTGDPRMSDPRPPTAGSSNYIQNGTSPQASSNFNISGTGTGNIFNATSQYNYGGSRLISNGGDNQSLFVGVESGTTSTGISDTFFGYRAGQMNTIGITNAFFGAYAGRSNTEGNGNTFIGNGAGNTNIKGTNNTFVGLNAGFNSGNITDSSFTANRNTFVGMNTGFGNETGSQNTFVGYGSNPINPGGINNTGIGTNVTASNGTINSTMLGAYSSATQSNSLILGSTSGVNGCTAANNCSTTNVGIGTTAPIGNLHVNVPGSGSPISALTVDVGTFGTGPNAINSYFFKVRDVGLGGTPAFLIRGDGNVGIGTGTPSDRFHVVGSSTFSGNVNINATAGVAGDLNVGGSGVITGNLGIGIAPLSKLHVFSNGAVRITADSDSNAGIGLSLNNQTKWSLATVSPGQFQIYNQVLNSNAVWIDIANNNVGIGTIPNDKLEVNGVIRLGAVGSAGGSQLCRNIQGQIANCSSSLRYKTNIGQFSQGLSFVNKLRPMSFDWKDGGMKDIGFGAEDVAKIDPRFVTYNDKGEIEGVKYDRLSVAFVNAFKEQQAEIESQRSQINKLQRTIDTQQRQIEAMKKILCQTNKAADLCRE